MWSVGRGAMPVSGRPPRRRSARSGGGRAGASRWPRAGRPWVATRESSWPWRSAFVGAAAAAGATAAVRAAEGSNRCRWARCSCGFEDLGPRRAPRAAARRLRRRRGIRRLHGPCARRTLGIAGLCSLEASPSGSWLVRWTRCSRWCSDARNRPSSDDHSVGSEELASPEPMGVGSTVRTRMRSMGRSDKGDRLGDVVEHKPPIHQADREQLRAIQDDPHCSTTLRGQGPTGLVCGSLLPDARRACCA